ncbi:MAG: MarR family transcriptional regulator, partial [Nitrosopumilaceae archaeon]
MAKAPILLAGLIIMAVAMPFQNSLSSTKNMDLIIYSDGSTHIFSEIEVDSLELDFALNLFGDEIDNFVAIGENDILLSSEISNDTATIGTFGSSTISINYDIHD